MGVAGTGRTTALTAAFVVGPLLALSTAAVALDRDGTVTGSGVVGTPPEGARVVVSRAPSGTPVRATTAGTSVEPDPAWVARTAHATGMPRPAARAYGRASIVVSREQPDCHVGWPTIAGIGSVESDHGRHDGARLRADGRPWPRIVGPALDGTNGTEAIPASADSEFFHGDDDWDHAVGPMQFIPSTWRTWGADGDGDGRADPNDIDDAALATARYLCADGRDLSTDSGWTDAVFSYNHSDDYVALVSRRARAMTR